MTDKAKKDLTETAVGRILDGKLEKLIEAQAKRDAEQDAKLARPSRMQKAVTVADDFDFTAKYPIPSLVMGASGIVAAFAKLQGVPMYIAVGIGVCFVPGLAMKVVRLATGLKKAKDGQ